MALAHTCQYLGRFLNGMVERNWEQFCKPECYDTELPEGTFSLEAQFREE
jgi:hypothetical protein